MKYRVQPSLAVVAIQYISGQESDALAFDARVSWGPKPWFSDSTSFLMVQTAYGLIEVVPGDFIVRAANESISVTTSERFLAVYDPDEGADDAR